MVTTTQVRQTLSKATGLPQSEVNTRLKWLAQQRIIPEGKRGPGGGANLEAKDIVNILLSLAYPEAKTAPAHVEEFAKLKTVESDGKEWTLRDALLDQIKLYQDGERLRKSEMQLDRILLIFDKDWPYAELDFMPRGSSSEQRSFADSRLTFFRGPLPSNISEMKLAQITRAVVLNGGVVQWIVDTLAGNDDG